jgi:hypothetical protein
VVRVENRLGTASDRGSRQVRGFRRAIACSCSERAFFARVASDVDGVLGSRASEIDLLAYLWRIWRQLLARLRARCYARGKERGARGLARRGTLRHAAGGRREGDSPAPGRTAATRQRVVTRPRRICCGAFQFFFLAHPCFLIRRGISGGVVARGSRVLLVTLARPRRVARVLWSRWTCAARVKFSVFAQENAEVYSTVDLDHLRIFNRGWMAEIY